MARLDIMQIPIECGDKAVTEEYGTINIVKQKTGYGYKRFFECPNCGARVRYLYLEDTFKCRHCLGHSVYSGTKNIYPGGDTYLCRLMLKIAKKYGIKFKVPFDYRLHALERPKYMRHDKWMKVMYQLQTLENMRFNIWLSGGTIEIKVIKHYLNEGLYDFTLQELQQRIIIWKYPARYFNGDPIATARAKIEKG